MIDCESNLAIPLNYCGDTLNVGTTEADDGTMKFVNLATGMVHYTDNTGTLPDIAVVLPEMSPNTMYQLSLVSGEPFTPYASDGVIGTVEVTHINVKFVKAFDGDGMVVVIEDQYLKMA